MKIVVTSSSITIGATSYPLNSLAFKQNGDNVSIYMIGTPGPIITDIYSNFTDSSNEPYASVAALITDLQTSQVSVQVAIDSLTVELDGVEEAIGAPDDASATSDTGTSSLISLFKRLLEKCTAGLLVFGKIVEIKPTLVIDAAAYTALDNIGGKQTLTSVARASGEGVFLESINIQVNEAVAPVLDIYFFNADPAAGTYTNNDAMVIGATDILKVVHVQQVVAADYKAVGTVRFASIAVKKDMVPSGSANLYAAIMVASGSPDFASTNNLQIAYIFER